MDHVLPARSRTWRVDTSIWSRGRTNSWSLSCPNTGPSLYSLVSVRPVRYATQHATLIRCYTRFGGWWWFIKLSNIMSNPKLLWFICTAEFISYLYFVQAKFLIEYGRKRRHSLHVRASSKRNSSRVKPQATERFNRKRSLLDSNTRRVTGSRAKLQVPKCKVSPLSHQKHSLRMPCYSKSSNQPSLWPKIAWMTCQPCKMTPIHSPACWHSHKLGQRFSRPAGKVFKFSSVTNVEKGWEITLILW